MDDRLDRMKRLLADLGGEEAVLAHLGLKKPSLKVALYNRMFPPAWFGLVAEMAAGRPQPFSVPADLFGTAKGQPWPKLNLRADPASSTSEAA